MISSWAWPPPCPPPCPPLYPPWPPPMLPPSIILIILAGAELPPPLDQPPPPPPPEPPIKPAWAQQTKARTQTNTCDKKNKIHSLANVHPQHSISNSQRQFTIYFTESERIAYFHFGYVTFARTTNDWCWYQICASFLYQKLMSSRNHNNNNHKTVHCSAHLYGWQITQCVMVHMRSFISLASIWNINFIVKCLRWRVCTLCDGLRAIWHISIRIESKILTNAGQRDCVYLN